MQDLRALTRRFVVAGRVERIFLRPGRGLPALAVDEATAVASRGLAGDRTAESPGVRSSTRGGSRRQVTLLQAEHVPLIARFAGLDALDPMRLRRNLVVSGINLVATRSPFADQVLELAIGDEVILVITGDCAPCSRMEESLGPGVYAAMRGHGGVTARVLVGGRVRIGDPVRMRGECADERNDGAGVHRPSRNDDEEDAMTERSEDTKALIHEIERQLGRTLTADEERLAVRLAPDKTAALIARELEAAPVTDPKKIRPEHKDTADE